jgi:hypothetical protein
MTVYYRVLRERIDYKTSEEDGNWYVVGEDNVGTVSSTGTDQASVTAALGKARFVRSKDSPGIAREAGGFSVFNRKTGEPLLRLVPVASSGGAGDIALIVGGIAAFGVIGYLIWNSQQSSAAALASSTSTPTPPATPTTTPATTGT